MNRLCRDQRMMRLIIAHSPLQLVAAFRHGGTEERVVGGGFAREPATGPEHRRHRALEDVQAFAVVDVQFAREVGQGGAERLERPACGAEVGTVGQRAGKRDQWPARRGRVAGKISLQRLAQRRQFLLVAGQVIVREDGGPVGGGKGEVLQQGICGSIGRGLRHGNPGGRGGSMIVLAAQRRMGELGLAIEQQGALGRHLVAVGEAGEHLGGGVADAAELDLAGGVGAVGLRDKDHRVSTVLQHRGARHEEGFRRLESHGGLGRLLVQQLAVGVVENDAHLGGAGRLVEVGINEGDRGGQDLAGQRRHENVDRLARADPREVGLVGVEHEPHAREVADLEQAVVRLDILALVDAPGNDGARHGGPDVHHGGGFQRALKDADFLHGEAELQQALLGGGAFREGEGRGAGAKAFDVGALGGEHLGTVDRGEGLAFVHLGPDEVDVQLLDAAGHAGGQDAVARVVVLDHAVDPQGADERAAAHRAGLDARDGHLARGQRDQVGIRRGLGTGSGDQDHAANGAFGARVVGLDPRMHRALVHGGVFVRRVGGRGGSRGDEGKKKEGEKCFHGDTDKRVERT